MAMGTINYMAPEQALNAAKVDRRADVYSLAVVAYYVLTRQIPVGDFPAPSYHALPFPHRQCAVNARIIWRT